MRGESLSSFLRNMYTYLYEREVIIMLENLVLWFVIFTGVFAALIAAAIILTIAATNKTIMEKYQGRAIRNMADIIDEGKRD